MKRKGVNKQEERPKAFLGAIIGAAAGIAGNIISAKKKAKAEEAAFQQAQGEQNRNDGIQQANAMTAAYANQDYVNQYKDKIKLKNGGKMKVKVGDSSDRIVNAKKFALGGKMSSMNDGPKPKRDTTNVKSLQVNGKIMVEKKDGSVGEWGNDIPNTNQSTVTSNILKRLSDKALGKDNTYNSVRDQRQSKTPNTIKPSSQYKAGGRKKYEDGGSMDLGSEAAGAAGGIGSLVTSIFSKPSAPKKVKKADVFNPGVAKTSITPNSYQVDELGNPVTAINGNTVLSDGMDTPIVNNMYTDRVKQARMGKLTKRSMNSGL